MPVISPPNSLLPKRECGKGALGMVDTKCHAGSSVFVLLSRKPALLELMDVVQFEGGGSEADSEADLALEVTCYNVPCPYSPPNHNIFGPPKSLQTGEHNNFSSSRRVLHWGVQWHRFGLEL